MKSFTLPKFEHLSLFQQAMTHRSYANETPSVKKHNERLEFLGDAILTFLCGEFLYKKYPALPEGKLTPLRASLVDEKQLAQFAIALDLGKHLLLGKGTDQMGGRQNPNLLSSAFEALIGAHYLDCDSDMNRVRCYVEPFFESVVEKVTVDAPNVNYKSELQHWAAVNHGENPVYNLMQAIGPDHQKQFTVEVQVRGKSYGRGTGRTKQAAEKDAARDALETLELL
ncbi:ribonuclease III [Alkalinema sp. FACHB-956]|uniref:ribonuclease III n=1 Tax=Alkalinema sp. FACHB-956 TaxID=2692768 RepID=UPI0016895C4C|nr:ribonuclease III [Alkalinema sp. FACHB-956]MBD2329844.1 ribonuclease III [Alkalinema sp. FACHB-956]